MTTPLKKKKKRGEKMYKIVVDGVEVTSEKFSELMNNKNIKLILKEDNTYYTKQKLKG